MQAMSCDYEMRLKCLTQPILLHLHWCNLLMFHRRTTPGCTHTWKKRVLDPVASLWIEIFNWYAFLGTRFFQVCAAWCRSSVKHQQIAPTQMKQNRLRETFESHFIVAGHSLHELISPDPYCTGFWLSLRAGAVNIFWVQRENSI